MCEHYVWPPCVSTMCEHSMCEHSMCEHHVWALYVWVLLVWALCVNTLCVSTLCVSTLCVSTMCEHSMSEHSMCEHSMCEHSMCEHSMCEDCVWALCVSTMCDHYVMFEHHVLALHVWALYVWAPYVWALCVSTMCEHHVWPLCDVWATCVSTPCVSTLCVSTLCVSTMCEPSMCEHSLCEHSMCEHPMCEHSMCEHDVWTLWAHKEEVLGPSSWICHCDLRSWRAGKYDNYHQKWTSKKLKSRKLRELPRKMNIEEVEARKHQKSKSFIMKTLLSKDHPRATKSTRITTKNEHRRSWRAKKVRELPRETPFQTLSRPSQITEKYENYHEKWTSKKLKSRKLRKFTHKTAARPPRHPQNYKNSHTKRTCKHETTKIATNSVRHLDLATRPFTLTVRTPSVKHTVWGKISNWKMRVIWSVVKRSGDRNLDVAREKTLLSNKSRDSIDPKKLGMSGIIWLTWFFRGWWVFKIRKKGGVGLV